MTENFSHQTVLLQEAVDALKIESSGCYVDGTFGRGGHSREILKRLGSDGCLLALDKDARAAGIIATPDTVTITDMTGFVALTARYPRQLAWY